MLKRAAFLFFGCLAVYLANGRARPEVDCVAAPYTAWSIVRRGSLDLRPYPELAGLVGLHVQQVPDGAWVSMRPPGGALTLVPFVAPLALVREAPPKGCTLMQVGKLASAVCVAGAAALFFLVCRRLAPASAWPATALFGLGTCLCSVASQASWMHGPATFWLCLALFALTREDGPRWRWSVLAGLALGLAGLTRPTAAFFAPATVAALLARRRWLATLGLALGGAVPAGLLLGINAAVFGHPFLGGYAGDKWDGAPPLWVGLGGLLLAPSRGVLVYSPALLLALPGAGLLVRPGPSRPWAPWRALLVTWLLASAVTLLFYARWHDWRGGWCFGPRFLCETMPALCLLSAVGYDGLRRRWQRGVGVGLVTLSVVVHLAGLFGYGGYAAWHWRHERNDQGRCLFSVRDTQIEAHVRATLGSLTGRRPEAPAGPDKE